MAMPSAAEIEVDEWPTPKVSYSLSRVLGNPLMPLYLRLVWKLSRRPVNDLMAVCLVAYIPNQLIVRGIENIMQCHGKFYHAEAGGEMAAMHAHTSIIYWRSSSQTWCN